EEGDILAPCTRRIHRAERPPTVPEEPVRHGQDEGKGIAEQQRELILDEEPGDAGTDICADQAGEVNRDVVTEEGREGARVDGGAAGADKAELHELPQELPLDQAGPERRRCGRGHLVFDQNRHESILPEPRLPAVTAVPAADRGWWTTLHGPPRRDRAGSP